MSEPRDEAVLELTRELVARPSVTPDDAGCQRLIADRLLPLGFQAEWFLCGEVSNLLLTRGTGAPSLWFLGHTDVVPPGPLEDWDTPPFEAVLRDGVLHGRGVADMKGAVAAMVVALEQFVAEQPAHRGQLGLLLTSDEEGIAVDGIVRVAEALRARGERPDHCLVGEPSSLRRLGDSVRIGRRGSIHATVTVRGVQGHTAYPEPLANPVHRLAPFLAELIATRWDEGDADFPETHCQVSNLAAGCGAENVTPATARVQFNLRNGTASPPETLEQRVRDMLGRHLGDSWNLDWRVSGRPFRSPAGALRTAVVASANTVLGVDPDLNAGGGTSDGRFIAPLGAEVVELGLVNTTIHQANEGASAADLERLAATYREIVRGVVGA